MDLGQELRLFGAKSTPPCWRKVHTSAPGRGNTATGRVRALREGGAEGQRDRKGRKGGSLKGEPLTQKRETGAQTWMDVEARPQVGTEWLSEHVPSQDKVW